MSSRSAPADNEDRVVLGDTNAIQNDGTDIVGMDPLVPGFRGVRWCPATGGSADRSRMDGLSDP